MNSLPLDQSVAAGCRVGIDGVRRSFPNRRNVHRSRQLLISPASARHNCLVSLHRKTLLGANWFFLSAHFVDGTPSPMPAYSPRTCSRTQRTSASTSLVSNFQNFEISYESSRP